MNLEPIRDHRWPFFLCAIFLLTAGAVYYRAPRERKASSPLPYATSQGVPGALVICGGGDLPDTLREEFVRLAGGPQARIVVFLTAGDDEDLEDDEVDVLQLFRAFHPASITYLHTRQKDIANDPNFSIPLRQATGVWFVGGKQTSLANSYTGTLVDTELHALLSRGGVIGGTSAGAAIMSRVMIVRGKVYRDPGLDFLPGAIIDQHFIARNRKPRLQAVMADYPGLFGVGIDEATALVVQGREMRALGRSTVTLLLKPTKTEPEREVVLKSGEVADLTEYRKLARARAWSELSSKTRFESSVR